MALLNPYLNFRGQAREAIAFYQSALGGDFTLSTFGDFQMPGVEEDEQDSVMHSQLTTKAGFTLMISDIPAKMPGEISNGTISISGGETDDIQSYWDALSDGAEVSMPLAQAPWGDYFGQLTDKFGVSWLVNITGPGAPAEG
jgi:PhnB protein